MAATEMGEGDNDAAKHKKNVAIPSKIKALRIPIIFIKAATPQAITEPPQAIGIFRDTIREGTRAQLKEYFQVMNLTGRRLIAQCLIRLLVGVPKPHE